MKSSKPSQKMRSSHPSLPRDSALDFGFSQQRDERTRDQSLTAQYSLQF
jgi:hypothetical protein